jgi:D-alanyl-lipoteichoic acid acyltransferase DltB (MBOAT superfamily)
MSWFTNYIFYPIVYKYRKLKRKAAIIGIVATFLISSIWHGIGLSFLLWVCCHILYLIFELITKNIRNSISEKTNPFIYKSISVFLVFNVVSLSYIFFRSSDSTQAFNLIDNIYNNFLPLNFLTDFIAPLAIGGDQINLFNFYTSIFLMACFLLFESKINQKANSNNFSIIYVSICVIMILLFGIIDGGERFIYMQF